MDLRITTRAVGDAVVVAIDGLADLASIPLLQDRLRREISHAPGATVIVDVDGLLAFDDVALGVLLGAAATARESGGDLQLLATASRWRERFERTRLDRAIVIRSSLAEPAS